MKKTVQRERKRKKSKIKGRVLLVLLLLCVIIGLMLFTPFFNVKNVEVTGNNQVPSEMILERAAVPQEVNLFRVNTWSIKKAVKTIPEIESVSIRRQLPSKLTIEVKETPAALYFPYKEGFAVTNKNGRVLSLVNSDLDLFCIKVTGLEIKNAEIYRIISVQDDVKFDIMVDIMTELEKKGLLPKVQSLHIDDVSNLYFYMIDGTKIILGKSTNLEYKFSMLSTVLTQITPTEGAYIDLTTPEKTVYGTLEPEETATPEEETEEETKETEETPAPTEEEAE